MISLTNIEIKKYIDKPDIKFANTDSILGKGGGKHIVLYQGDISFPFLKIKKEEYEEMPKCFVNLTKKMLEIFKEKLPYIVIEELYAEHRLYYFDDNIFTGEIHDDCSEYTIICYYDIGKDIEGGELGFFRNCDSKTIINSIKPITGDIIIFSKIKKHGLLNTKAIGPSNQRYLWSIFINGHF